MLENQDLNPKILFLVSSLRGGGNRAIIEIANVLSQKNFCCQIVYPQNQNASTFEINSEVKLTPVGITIPINSASKIINFLMTWCSVFLMTWRSVFLKKHKIDYIIVTNPLLSPLMWLVNHSTVYIFIQADDYKIFDDLHVFKSLFLLNVYKMVTRNISYQYKEIKYIFNSKYSYNQFIINSNRKDVSYRKVFPGINQKYFYCDPISKTKKLSRLETVVIAYIARKHPLKGLLDFTKAVNDLDKDIKNQVQLQIISDESIQFEFDCKLRYSILKPISDQEIGDALRNSDIFVCSSWWEGFGLPALEAMACGCALVTSDNGGCKEYARNEENCLMFEPKNHIQLTSCIKRIVLDNQLRQKLAKASAITAQKFTWKNSARQLIDVLSNAK